MSFSSAWNNFLDVYSELVLGMHLILQMHWIWMFHFLWCNFLISSGPYSIRKYPRDILILN